jgi:hypothetical protein
LLGILLFCKIVGENSASLFSDKILSTALTVTSFLTDEKGSKTSFLIVLNKSLDWSLKRFAFTSTSGSSSQSTGIRRSANLNTTTATKTVATCTTPGSNNPQQTTVEKGEASSTTSSPKTEQQLLSASKIKKEGPQVSPVSSTHPDTVAGDGNLSSPNSNEEDGGVSSTT